MTSNDGTSGCLGVTLVLCFTGAGYFIQTESMAAMLPPWGPGRVPLVHATGGVFELAAASLYPAGP